MKTPTNLLLLPLSLFTLSNATDTTSKRGISVLDTEPADWSLLTSSPSPLSWYWNWSPWPVSSALVSSLIFVPQLHGIDNLAADITQAKTVSENSTHLLTFNEPDGTTSSGGSSIEPEDAAKAYIESILPLRKSEGGRFLISHPATTGSANGLEWLAKFNESCYDINEDSGCPLDFIAAHWYGDFPGLTAWIDSLDSFYNNASNPAYDPKVPLKIWITELALPQQDEDATVQMLNSSLSYLDAAEQVEGYAWFGNFRADESNEWTGKNVALWDKNGGLTELGAKYLNPENGTASFKEGQKGKGNAAGMVVVERWGLFGLVFACAVVLL